MSRQLLFTWSSQIGKLFLLFYGVVDESILTCHQQMAQHRYTELSTAVRGENVECGSAYIHTKHSVDPDLVRNGRMISNKS
jgi:hypothetical protein